MCIKGANKSFTFLPVDSPKTGKLLTIFSGRVGMRHNFIIFIFPSHIIYFEPLLWLVSKVTIINVLQYTFSYTLSVLCRDETYKSPGVCRRDFEMVLLKMSPPRKSNKTFLGFPLRVLPLKNSVIFAWNVLLLLLRPAAVLRNLDISESFGNVTFL